jgi:hypothetical protein
VGQPVISEWPAHQHTLGGVQYCQHPTKLV